MACGNLQKNSVQVCNYFQNQEMNKRKRGERRERETRLTTICAMRDSRPRLLVEEGVSERERMVYRAVRAQHARTSPSLAMRGYMEKTASSWNQVTM